ncbi:MAG: hypothetical protein Q9191_001833 [Dirinaria sp. TL-2023a]
MGSLSEVDCFLSHKLTHIVVGGGTAGLVVAARLSEDPTITVGVLEAGPSAHGDPRINVPGRLGETLFTEYDWQFETTPQHACNGRKIPWNRGRVLGGSSALNFMMWCRGNKGDYDAWEKLGNKDPKTQERCYSVPAYYLPASQRKNLVVLTEATARDVILEKKHDSTEWIAKGVRFIHKGQEYAVHASGEIVLSAGSVQSPQLLELSGVGNTQILEAGGVETKINNPKVGENLQDHMVTMMIYELDPSIITPESIRNDPSLAAAVDEEYATSKTGPRTAVSYSAAYLPFSYYMPGEEISRLATQLPKIEPVTPQLRNRILSERLSSPEKIGQIEWIFDVSNYSPFYKSEPGKRYGTIMQMLQYPFSVGSIHIPVLSAQNGKASNSDDKPVIDPRYYGGAGGQVDFLTMAAAQRSAHKICSTRPLADIIVKRVFPPAPSDRDLEQEDFASWVRETTVTDWHPVGTCAMGGHEGIDGGVVDDRLRVYGIQGLRVCDASIMPLQIAAHLQATVYAIGEKGADMIKEDWRARNAR